MGCTSGYIRNSRGIVVQRDKINIQSAKRALRELLGGIGNIRRNIGLINHSKHGIGPQG
jgi:hypothetical protein